MQVTRVNSINNQNKNSVNFQGRGRLVPSPEETRRLAGIIQDPIYCDRPFSEKIARHLGWSSDRDWRFDEKGKWGCRPSTKEGWERVGINSNVLKTIDLAYGEYMEAVATAKQFAGKKLKEVQTFSKGLQGQYLETLLGVLKKNGISDEKGLLTDAFPPGRIWEPGNDYIDEAGIPNDLARRFEIRGKVKLDGPELVFPQYSYLKIVGMDAGHLNIRAPKGFIEVHNSSLKGVTAEDIRFSACTIDHAAAENGIIVRGGESYIGDIGKSNRQRKSNSTVKSRPYDLRMESDGHLVTRNLGDVIISQPKRSTLKADTIDLSKNPLIEANSQERWLLKGECEKMLVIKNPPSKDWHPESCIVPPPPLCE